MSQIKQYDSEVGVQATRDRGQVEINLERVCNLAEEAFKQQHEIEQRLSSICRADVPTGAESKRPQEVLVPLADTLSAKADTLGQLVEMQRSLLRRIEL